MRKQIKFKISWGWGWGWGCDYSPHRKPLRLLAPSKRVIATSTQANPMHQKNQLIEVSLDIMTWTATPSVDI
ncbi:hypothetical protein [Oceanobacillus jeddahense]|uniref:hypothetical protein n=1 Tax=Oceanobacillus jeddahense TaxID=1462527 RepID=UPI000595A0A7|nr:hypothetical protein [Oceanobacillus jeddahense]